MALTYTVCVSNVATATSVDLTSPSVCSVRLYTDIAGCEVVEETKIATFTATVASDTTFRIYFNFTKTFYVNGIQDGSPLVVSSFVDMPAGATTVTKEIHCNKLTTCGGAGGEAASGIPEGDDGGNTTYEQEFDNYAVSTQRSIPICVEPPAECTLEITGTTTTDVTLRGDDDGSITVAFSGSTGTTTCYIDGVSDGTTTTDSYDFTGLAAGYYDIRITEGDCFDQTLNVQIVDGEFRTGDFSTNEPSTLSAVENPIILNLKTSRTGDTPLPSKGYIAVGGTVTDGDKIVFNFTYPQSYTATFYAKGFPNRDSYFLASELVDSVGGVVGTNSASEIATSILEVLENDTFISRLYWLSSIDNKVYLTAKENNTSFDLNNVCTITATNISKTQTQNGAADYDGQLSQNYSLYADISVNPDIQYGETPDDTSFNKVAQIELPFNPLTNQHLFDLSDTLKNFVSTPKIDFTLTGYTTIASMLGGYQVEYGEKYPLVQNSSTKKARTKGSVETKYFLNSALQWENVNNMSEYIGSPFHNVKADFGVDITFNQPTDNYTYIDIDDYLINPTGTTTTDIEFRIIDFDNGDTYDWQTGSTFTLTGATASPYSTRGYIYITGTTDSVAFGYSKYFDSSPEYDAYTVGDTIYPAVLGDVKFLTNSPNPKFVQRDSSEFLYLLLPKDYGKTLKIKGDLYFYDGTSLTGETLYTVSTGSTNWGGVFMFASGYNELGLADYESYSGGTRKIRKVDFALYQTDANGDYLLSEEKSYRYEIDEQPRRYGVAFLNKLGTYDIFDFSGEIVNTVTHSNEGYEVPREINIQGGSPLGFQANTVYNTKVVKSIAANTGWISEETFDWLIELLESNRCYNYTETDQSFLIVNTVSYEKSSNDDLYQIDVTFTETLYQNNISV